MSDHRPISGFQDWFERWPDVRDQFGDWWGALSPAERVAYAAGDVFDHVVLSPPEPDAPASPYEVDDETDWPLPHGVLRYDGVPPVLVGLPLRDYTITESRFVPAGKVFYSPVTATIFVPDRAWFTEAMRRHNLLAEVRRDARRIVQRDLGRYVDAAIAGWRDELAALRLSRHTVTVSHDPDHDEWRMVCSGCPDWQPVYTGRAPRLVWEVGDGAVGGGRYVPVEHVDRAEVMRGRALVRSIASEHLHQEHTSRCRLVMPPLPEGGAPSTVVFESRRAAA